MYRLAFLLAALGVTAQAHVMKVKESHRVPRGWTKTSRPDAEMPIKISIALKQGNFPELERHLYEVSDPDHPRYGNHLTQEHVNSLVQPSLETSDLVHEWLEQHNLNATRDLSYSPARDWITITLPIAKVEEMLDTEYHVYKHNDGSQLVRAPQWSLPDFLHDHITAVQPTTSFFRATPKSMAYKPVKDAAMSFKDWKPMPDHYPGSHPPPFSAPNVSAVCNVSIVTPLCLRTLYGTVNYTTQAAGENKVGLVNYLGENNNRSDVQIFLEMYRPEAAGAAYTFPIIQVNGGSVQQTPLSPDQLAAGTDLEGNLDAETILGISYPTPLTAYSVGGSPPFKPDQFTPTDTNEPYLEWLSYILAQPDDQIPQVISTSYEDDEQTVPPAYAQTVCNQFAQLGARGVSLLFGSGDEGVGPEGDCYTNDGRNASAFLPEFPSSCPYVTSVGATRNFSPEIVAYDSRNGFASGGGFSNYFARPAYQNAAVSGYLSRTLGSTYAGLYNASGRAYPDIAAQGQRFATVWDGRVVLLDGTSASTPAAAAVLSLVNDALLAKGKKPLGFLNPWLYSRGYKTFTDVTNGTAIGCGVDGFPAAKGWDPVTGWGTPFFGKIVAERLGFAYGHGGF